MGLDVFAWHLADPRGDCRALRVIVAAKSATTAAETLRRSGWRGVRSKQAQMAEPDERMVALDNPDMILWRDWDQDPPYDWRSSRLLKPDP
jgi:hypothetical protein